MARRGECGVVSYMSEPQQCQGTKSPGPNRVATEMHTCCVAPLARTSSTVLHGCAWQAHISDSNAVRE
ncbi:MAG: hypothetical protein EP297_11370 [Gammaproteobacteria bacterium]|nr:MAG: hypothetical protein EP297_11370 [Gammaproteobacteria bacterium]